MGSRETSTVIIIILYVTGALLLMITAYILYLKKYKRGTLEALNNVEFVTSRYDKYTTKTQFLIDLPRPSFVALKLLNNNEELVKNILDVQYETGQHTVKFDPAEFSNGTYFLSLVTDHATILRKITIENTI